MAVNADKKSGAALVRLLSSHGACLAEDERNMQCFVKEALGLVLTLLEKTSTSLTVSWTECWNGAVAYTVVLELPGSNTVSSAKLDFNITKYTFGKIGLNPMTSYKLCAVAWDSAGHEISRGPLACFDTGGDDGGYGNIIPRDSSLTSGLALIFSMTEDRPGGEVDQRRIFQLLQDLRFEVVLCENPTTEDVDEKCNWAKSRTDSLACFICVIMGHGRAGHVGIKNGAIDLKEDVFQHFKANKCKAFRGKPKIFIVNACRGSGRTVMYGMECDDANVKTFNQSGDIESDLHLFEKSVPDESDMLFAYATLDGSVAWRDREKGTWFISTLIDVLREKRHEEHFGDMLAMVNQRVIESRRTFNDQDKARPGEDTKMNIGQAAEIITRGWRGKLFFRE
uniref:Caspase family p20 domain-containing protein n=1 Tax=Mantoniella antarctica TaxID=81844 RepID=A0A7S0S796_9CHLO